MAKRPRPETGTEAERNRELAEARNQIKLLTRQVARLQKRLEKYETQESVEESPSPTLAQSEGASPAPEAKAPRCGCGASDWSFMTTPSGRVIQICNSCKERTVTKGQNDGQEAS